MAKLRSEDTSTVLPDHTYSETERSAPADRALTHLDAQGHAQMVDVGGKGDSERVAVARASVLMQRDTLAMITEGRIPKGDVMAVARVAGIMAAKKTSSLIPLCHPLMLTHVSVDFSLHHGAPARVDIESTVRTVGKTGVEMEAMMAASVAALTIYDMAKAVDRAMRITDVRLARKQGGKSGNIILEP